MKFQYFNFTKFVLKCLWIIWTVIPTINGLKVDSDGKEHDVDLIMPGATSPGKDSYRCSAFQVKNGPVYIHQFTANANASKAHHMILQKCTAPKQYPGQIWDCRHHATCDSQPRIMYAWARDAPPTILPDDVAFKLEPNDFIVLQIHYANQFEEPDHTSVTLKVSSKKPKYFAGIYILWKGFFRIPPGVTASNADINCKVRTEPPLHIFAFRPHAHTLGRRIIGVKKSGSSGSLELFADGDPLKPQAFYSLEKTITLSKGDGIFARCVYDSRSKSTVTNIGATAGDEMCNLYLMYYNEDEKHDYIDCGRQDDPAISRAVDARMEAEFAPAAKIKPEPKSIGITTNNKPLLGHRLNLNFKIGDVCGIAYDIFGNVVLLNRGNHHWDMNTFDMRDQYTQDRNEPISENTVITINSTGHVISQWGSDFFFLPHMITIDAENNVWITDVAMHQVFKFGPYGGPDKKPLIELGTKFKPGNDNVHYCKPTAVAVMSDSRTFFVSDGYCNQRIIKYVIRSINEKGYHSVVKVSEFGANNIPFQPNVDKRVYNFKIPHALALFENKQLICVADRENSLVQCFDLETGIFKQSVRSIEPNSRIYSIASANSQLAVLMGPQARISPSKLFLYDMDKNEVTNADLQFENEKVDNPHDVSMTPDGQNIVVANLKPSQVWLFQNQSSIVRVGKAFVKPVNIVNSAQPIDEAQKSPESAPIVLMKNNDEAKSPWNVLLLLVVFTTGGTVILYYIRVMRRKRAGGDGFQPLNTKEEIDVFDVDFNDDEL